MNINCTCSNCSGRYDFSGQDAIVVKERKEKGEKRIGKRKKRKEKEERKIGAGKFIDSYRSDR